MGLMRDCEKCGKELDIENLEGVSIPGEYMFDNISGLGYDTAKVYCRKCSREIISGKIGSVSNKKPCVKNSLPEPDAEVPEKDEIKETLKIVLKNVEGTKFENFIRSLDEQYSKSGSLSQKQLISLNKFGCKPKGVSLEKESMLSRIKLYEMGLNSEDDVEMIEKLKGSVGKIW